MADKGPALPRGLYALIDDGLRPGGELAWLAQAVFAGGARILQLRVKHVSDRAALGLARQVVNLAREHGAVVLINDRVDLALLAKADGVHLGDEDLSPAQARRLLGPAALIGVTTRSLEQIEIAAAAGANYVGLGPIFATATKAVPHPLLGLEGLQRIAARSPLPIVAIAGIRLSNIGAVAHAGAQGAAVAAALLEGADPSACARALQAEFLAN